MRTNDTSYPRFSFFNGPITNKHPRASITLSDVHRGLTKSYYRQTTEQLRETCNPEERRNAKQKLDYVTFAGTFSKRQKQCLINYSGYVCIDFDHIEPDKISEIKSLLLKDEMFETQLLFVSPSGTGLKWIIEVDLDSFPDYEINFKGIVAYLRKKYTKHFNVECNYIDETGKDVARACFLCYDPQAYINPKFNTDELPKV